MENQVLTDDILIERIEQILHHRAGLKGTLYEQMPLNLVRCNAGQQTIEFCCDTTPWMKNAAGQMHGGIIATIFDMAMGILGRAFTGAETTATITLQISYVRPVKIGSVLYTRVRMTGAGKSIIYAVAEAWPGGAEDRICATATGSFFKLRNTGNT